MTDTIRCPACRGAKKVPKLGGMIGECNTCNGKGTILLTDKPKPIEVVTSTPDSVVIQSVADCVPATSVPSEAKPVSLEAKKALYKGNRKVNIK